jgi:hypothetical protein
MRLDCVAMLLEKAGIPVRVQMKIPVVVTGILKFQDHD